MKKLLFFTLTIFAFSAFVPMALVSAKSNGSNRVSTTTPPVINPACMTTAVTARENGIAAAFEIVTDTTSAALTLRKSELVAAWGLTNSNERKAAVKAAWLKYKNTVKKARLDYKAEAKNIWKTFNTAARACQVKNTGESSGLDTSLM